MPLRNLTVGGGNGSRPIHPNAIFATLTLRGLVQNLWAPQSDALDSWFAEREHRDSIIEMATGGGKTIVGLLSAQSICNENRAKVLYLCPNKQLVEQTAEKAQEIGLNVAVYLGSRTGWKNRDTYVRCDGPCIASYAAAFTHNSVFRNDEIAGLVLDDAHVAASALRDQFTLKISQQHQAFRPLITQLRPYFAKTGRASSLEAAIDGEQYLLFVPGFVFLEQAQAIATLLRANGVEDDDSTKFPWQYIEEHIDRCFASIGPNGIEIGPTTPPVHAVRVHRNATRRVFLTATLPSSLELARVFGLGSGVPTIRPNGKLGAAQRQILFMRGTDGAQHRLEAQKIIAKRKACIVVTSRNAAKKWNGTVFGRSDDHSTIVQFAIDLEPVKLILVARFD